MISDTTPDNFDASVLSGVTATVSDGTALQVQGEYMSDVFNAKPERNLTLRVDSVVTLNSQQVLQVNVRDNLSGEVGTLFFQPNVISSPNSAILMLQEGDYRRMVNGLNMKLIPPGGSLVMPDLIGFAYQFSFRGRSSSFTINYLYDPIVNAADALSWSATYRISLSTTASPTGHKSIKRPSARPSATTSIRFSTRTCMRSLKSARS